MHPQIFLSYSWKDIDIANAIDKDWQDVGITLIRDVRDVSYKGNLKEFMKRVHDSDFVLLLISKAYLESKNCMYEALEMFEDQKFKEKILPILTADAKINDPLVRLDYIQHWEEQRRVLDEQLRRMSFPSGVDSVVRELRHFDKIRESIDGFASQIQDILCASWPTIQQQGYSDIFNHIGYKQGTMNVIEECSRVLSMEDSEDQELAIDELKAKYPDTPVVTFTEGNIAFRAGRYKVARKLFETIITAYPEYYPAHINLAFILKSRAKDYAGARMLYEQALEINPNSATAQIGLALVNDQEGNSKDARLDYERAIELSPEESSYHAHYAIFLRGQLDYPKAQYHFEQAIALNPNDADAHSQYGLLLGRDLQDYALARKHFELALAIDPNHLGAHANLGLVLEKELFKDYAGARQHYEFVLAIDPNEKVALLNYAGLLKDYLEEPDEAKRLLEHLLSLDPDNADAHAQLGVLLATYFDDASGARQHYERALELNPNHATAHSNFGALLIDHFGDSEGALKHLEKAITLDSNAAAHHNLGSLFSTAQQNYAKAQYHYKQSLALDPSQDDTSYHLGEMLIKHCDDFKGGCQYLERAIKLAPQNADYQLNFAVLIAKQEPLLAKQYYLSACALNPSFRTPNNDGYFGVEVQA